MLTVRHGCDVLVRRLAASDGMLIVGCSALRHIYRDWIREQAKRDVVFLHLSGNRAVIERRMSAREGHFMPVQLLDSQFATLEPLHVDETAFVVDIDQALRNGCGKTGRLY